METFVLTIAIYYAIDIAATLICLGARRVPGRTAGGMAFNAIINIGIVAWAIKLL